MNNNEIRLESVTWENVDGMIANSESGNIFFPLPCNDDEAERYIHQVNNHRRHGMGDLFNAYTTQNVLVGGGQIVDAQEAVQLGYWVALNKRRRGFGKAIVAALEREAREILPARECFELEIDARNLASLALAISMEYRLSQARDDGTMIYRKQRS